jgi:hypothetical protein
MSERLDKIRKRISPEVKERVDRDIQIIDTAISDYKSRLKKEIERAIIEVDEDLKFWSRHPGRGRSNSFRS